MNVFTGVGRVGRDAEARETADGSPMATWPVAIDFGWGDRKGSLWLSCTLFGNRGEALSGHIRKGDRISVSGELGQREHNEKTYLTLNVREVTLLGDKTTNKREPDRTEPRSRGRDHNESQRRHENRPEYLHDDIPF